MTMSMETENITHIIACTVFKPSIECLQPPTQRPRPVKWLNYLGLSLDTDNAY